MSRNKTEINPIRAERLKIIIERENMTQTAFSKSVNYSQQLISHIINKQVALTEGTAKDIISHYPEYRLQWLMGYDDFMTQKDLEDNYNFVNDEILQGMWGLFEKCLIAKGKTMKFNHPSDLSVNLSERDLYGCYYSIQDQKGNELKRLSPQEMKDLEQKLLEYCDLLTMKLLVSNQIQVFDDPKSIKTE